MTGLYKVSILLRVQISCKNCLKQGLFDTITVTNLKFSQTSWKILRLSFPYNTWNIISGLFLSRMVMILLVSERNSIYKVMMMMIWSSKGEPTYIFHVLSTFGKWPVSCPIATVGTSIPHAEN